jgi:hypothetical protein
VHISVQQTQFIIDRVWPPPYPFFGNILEVLVRTVTKAIFVAILTASLAGIPLLAGTPHPATAPLGVVLQADHAIVGTDLIATGATVYAGDTLETNESGTLRARLGGPQVFLRPSTTAQVQSLENGFSATLKRGTVVISSDASNTFELLADGAAIRPAGAQPVVAQVTLVNPNELLLTSTRGALLVSMGDEVRTVESGRSYRMEVESESSGPGPQGSGGGPLHTARNHFLLLVIVGAAAGTSIGIWRAVTSPSAM